MHWSKEAEEALSKVPFFVRKRVRKRVEEEASRCGAPEVTLVHVQICQKRFLNRMEDEVKGFQVETCFGPTGCPNRLITRDIARAVEVNFEKRDLKSFLKEKVKGPLKIHHEFRVSISDCPNACSRPQIADVGLIGASIPGISEEDCIQCRACVDACREGAVFLAGKWPVLNKDKCVACGQCISACSSGTLRVEKKGFRIQVGGKLGRHPRLAQELPGIFTEDEALVVIERCLDHYQKYCVRGERFGEILESTGIKDLGLP